MTEDNGKSFITLDMDETRELRWNFRNIQRFEERARRVLKQQDVLGPGVSINTGMVLTRFLRNADILVAAVAAATGLSGVDGKNDELSQAGVAIQAYINKGGNLETLQKEIYHSYLVTNDPSSIVEWEYNLANDAEMTRINKEKAETLLEMERTNLAEQKRKLEEMKKLSGSGQAESAT